VQAPGAADGPDRAAGCAVCELCRARCADGATAAAAPRADSEPGGCPEPLACPRAPPAPPRRLRILCLHGFRQDGRKLRGCWAGLIRRLADLAAFDFLDAPHELPLLYRPRPARAPPGADAAGCRSPAVPAAPAVPTVAHKEAEPGRPPRSAGCRGACCAAAGACGACGACGRGSGDGDGAAADDARALDGASCAADSPTAHDPAAAASEEQVRSGPPGAPPPPPARPKRAWLVEPAGAEGGPTGRDPGGAAWRTAPAGLDAGQHVRQVGGWRASLAVLERALAAGRYDGVMGFSQVAPPPGCLANPNPHPSPRSSPPAFHQRTRQRPRLALWRARRPSLQRMQTRSQSLQAPV